jgi:acetoacetate decarboxylase
MQPTEVLSHVTTPLVNPAFAPVIPRFTNREYLNITYRTDPDALRAVVPEPLRIEEPLVRFVWATSVATGRTSSPARRFR